MAVTQDEEFEAWYQRVRPRVGSVLHLAALGDPSLVVEAADEAFVRAYERWPRVRRMANPDGWVYRVALDVLRTRQRRARREPTRPEVIDDRSSADRPRDLDLWAAVGALPPRAREMVALRYLTDLTEPQIADLLGVSRGHVAATLHDARGRLAAALRSDRVERSERHG